VLPLVMEGGEARRGASPSGKTVSSRPLPALPCWEEFPRARQSRSEAGEGAFVRELKSPVSEVFQLIFTGPWIIIHGVAHEPCLMGNKGQERPKSVRVGSPLGN